MVDGEVEKQGMSGTGYHSWQSSAPHVAEAGPSNSRTTTLPSTLMLASAHGEDVPIAGYRWYLSHLQRHAVASKKHLNGQNTLARHGDLDRVFASSSVSPSAASWSPQEKGVFFASLSRHSRHRPDLISAEMPTKSSAEIEWYLATLEQALKRHRREDRDRNYGSKLWHGRSAPAAREVEPEWMARENALADMVERTISPSIAMDTSAIPVDGMERELEAWGKSLNKDDLFVVEEILHEAFSSPSEEKYSQFPSDLGVNPLERDEHEIALISSVPKGQRTVIQRERLRTLVNKKRNRETYRRRVLLAEGISADEIIARGGPDAIFAAEGRTPDLGERQAPHKKGGKESDPTAIRLRELGVGHYFGQRGWEVFNYFHFGELMEIYDQRLTSDNIEKAVNPRPTLSFPLISQIYAEMIAYLKPLIYQSIVLAELNGKQSSRQSAEVEEKHVRAALSLRGEQDSKLLLQKAINDWKERVDAGDRPHVASSTSAAKLPFSERVKSRLSRTAVDVASWPVASLFPPDSLDTDPSYVSDSDESMVTQEEDLALERALDAADAAHDAVLALQLQAAADADDPNIIVDNEVWADEVQDENDDEDLSEDDIDDENSSSEDNDEFDDGDMADVKDRENLDEPEGRELPVKQPSGEKLRCWALKVSPLELEQASKAQTMYKSLLISTMKERRRRRALRRRSDQVPIYLLRKLSRRKRSGKIVESEAYDDDP